MENKIQYFFYHDDDHVDDVEWIEVEGYSGWVVTACNCQITNAALLPDATQTEKQEIIHENKS